ncbi:MAG: hypothetical protein ABIN35_01180 [candidate division WOR-3 bacterium]
MRHNELKNQSDFTKMIASLHHRKSKKRKEREKTKKVNESKNPCKLTDIKSQELQSPGTNETSESINPTTTNEMKEIKKSETTVEHSASNIGLTETCTVKESEKSIEPIGIIELTDLDVMCDKVNETKPNNINELVEFVEQRKSNELHDKHRSTKSR